jgi:hypothetical protein
LLHLCGAQRDDRKAEEGERKRLMGRRELDRNDREQVSQCRGTWRKATAARTSLRDRIIQPKVRSTTQRRDKTLKTGSAVRRRRTTSKEERRVIYEMGAVDSQMDDGNIGP